MKYALESNNYAKAVKFGQIQGLDVKHGQNWPTVLATINAAFPDITEFELIEDDDDRHEPVAGPVQSGKLTAHWRDDPIVMINIASDIENGGSHPAPVCHNGDHFLIQRNADVRIPYRAYLALRDAKQTDYRQEINPLTGRPITVSEERHTFRFTVTEMPSKAEIAAWHERTKDIGADKIEDESLKAEAQAGGALELLTAALSKALGNANAAAA